MTVNEPESAAVEESRARGVQRVSLLAGPTAGIAFVGGTLLAVVLAPSVDWTVQPFDALGISLHLGVIVGSLLGIVFLWSVWRDAEHRIQRAGIGLFGFALLMMALVNAVEVAFTAFPESAGILGVLGFMIGIPSAMLVSGIGDVVAGFRRRGFASFGLWIVYFAFWVYGFQTRALPVVIGFVWLVCISTWMLVQYASLRA
jgi:hypothetical protein